MIHNEFYIPVHNTKIYGQYFQPKTVKAVVVLVHGMGEHSKRYENFVIPYLHQHAIAVLSYDQFGHGLTEGKRGHNPGFEAVLDCLQKMLKKADAIFGKKPTFLYGHSMGGNVVINYGLRRAHHLKGIIATSPFLKLAFEPPAWKIRLGKILQKISPSITMGNELEVEAISRDSQEVEKYKKDPWVHDKISPNYSITFIETGAWAIKHANQLKTPMLLMHGTGDRLTSSEASVEFAKNAPDKVTLKLFEGAYHELHNDFIKNELLETMTSWIDKNINEQ